MALQTRPCQPRPSRRSEGPVAGLPDHGGSARAPVPPREALDAGPTVLQPGRG